MKFLALSAAVAALAAACAPAVNTAAAPTTTAVRADATAVALSGPAETPVAEIEEPQQTPPATGACPSRPIAEYATRMVGAEPTKVAYWPGFAAIGAVSPDGKQTTFFCGGVLVDPRTVITAAHCLNDARRRTDGSWHARVGGAEWQLAVLTNQGEIAADGPTTRAKVVSGATYREGDKAWDRNTVVNDIAFLKLDRDIRDQPFAKLAGNRDADPGLNGHFMWAAGFGQLDAKAMEKTVPTRSGGSATAQSDLLRDAVLPLVSEAACKAVYSRVDGRQICAGWARGKRDTCYGDSGGPLVAYDRQGCPYVVGVTSFGSTKGCGVEGTYGVYTRLSAFNTWIKTNAPGAQFVAEPPVAMGAEATSKLLEILIEDFAAKSQGLKVEMLNRDSGQPFPVVNGRQVVPVGATVAYRVAVTENFEGDIVLVDRKTKRTSAGGQLSREYMMLFPNSFLFQSTSARAKPGAPMMLGAGNDFRLRAGIDEPGATVEQGEVIALVLPPSVKLADLIAPPDRTRSFKVEAGDDFPKATTALEAANALLARPAVRTAGGEEKFGSATVPYEIRAQ